MRLFPILLLILLTLHSCDKYRKEKIDRPRDPWAFRSVLDKKPRMLTLALDSSMYAAYDLQHCELYKVWKGGINLEGAAFTNKKNVQPQSWGTPYAETLQNKWQAEINGKKDSFEITSKGYLFEDGRIHLKYQLLLSTGDTILIDESPEYFLNHNGNPGLEREFMISGLPSGAVISLTSPSKSHSIKQNGRSRLIVSFKPLPSLSPPLAQNEYDHRGRYWMEKSDCFTCHEVDKKTVGPAFTEIANRYGDEENAARHLVKKIKEGGSGVWGKAAMNPHPDLSESDIIGMLDYILALKSTKTNSSSTAAAQPKKEVYQTSPGYGAPLESVHPSWNVQTLHTTSFRPKVGGLAFLPDGRLLVTTWDSIGAVYMLIGVQTGDTGKITIKQIASGLAEPLGIEVADGDIYVLQKQELTKLIDHNGDEITDEYQTICNSWGVTGDFHEFSFGLVYKDGYFYATLSMAMRLMSNEKQKPDRGKTIRIGKDGKYEWINYGLRTPNGIGLGVDNEIFVADNQGEWVPANKLIHVKKGEYHGMRWGHLDSLTPLPPVAMPAIWLPEDEIGNSPSEPVLIKHGIFAGQMLHGDVTYGGIQRDFLEKINGQFQGAVFRFTQGLAAGVNRLRWGPDSALYIGGVGMVGGWSWKEKQYGLQRMTFNGKPVFEMLAIRAQHDGFEIEFTEPIDKNEGWQAPDINIEQWWYLPTAAYGGPKMDHEKLKIKSVSLSNDRKKMRLVIPGLKKQRVVYFRMPRYMKSENNLSLWSSEAWYTLNDIPAK